MEKIEYEILDSVPSVKKGEKYYYFYKVVNKLNGMFYYGVHSAKNLDDGYSGSSKKLKRDIKSSGITNFKKYILKFFNSSDEMYDYEKSVVTKDVVLKKGCYNMHTDGNGSWDFTIGRVCVKDLSGNTMMVAKDDENYISGNLVSNMEGMVHVKSLNGEQKTITKEEYHSNKNLYRPLIDGYVLAKGKDGVSKWIKKEEFDNKKNSGEVVGHTKNKGVFRTANGECVMCSMNDKRVSSGELVGATKGLGVYKYRDDFSKVVMVPKDDPRVKSGKLVGINYGLVFCIDPVTKKTFSVKKDDERIKSGEIMTWTRYLCLTGRKQGNGKKLLTLDYYKSKYPKVFDGFEQNNTTKEISEKTGLSKRKIEYLKSRYKLVKDR